MKEKLSSLGGIVEDPTGSDGDDGFSVSLFVLKCLAFAAVVAVVWFFRPWFHPLFYAIRYSTLGAIGLGLPLILAVVLFFSPRIIRDDQSSAQTKATLFGVCFMFCLVLGLVVSGVGAQFEQRTMAQETMDNVEIIDEPPSVNEQNPRVAPRAVSDTQTDGTLSYPQHTLGTSDIARAEDGTLVWSYTLKPDQIRNQFTDQQIGMVHADMTSMEDRNLETYDEHEFRYGQNMRLRNNVEWQLKKGGYWSQYQDDPYEFVYEGDVYMAFPKTGQEWHFTPVPHTTPTWDGVALVHQDGTIEHLDAEEAQERPELDGQRLYPLHNTEQYAESLQYREGIVNQMGTIGSFENVVEPASMPSGVGNDQPFVIDMEGERMNYLYAMEPAGGGTGLSEIWFFDAETGEPQAYETGGDNVFGPDRAVGIARGTDTRTEWGPDGEAMAVEPVLMTVDGDLYWHIKVTTSDQTDVVRNIFISADGGGGGDPEDDADDAVVMESSTEVEEFIAGDIDEDELDDAEDIEIEDPEDEDDDTAYYIVIVDEDGTEVDRIPVEEGQETVIDTEENDE